MSDLKDLMRQRAQRKADLTLDQLRGMSARNETAELTAEEWLPLGSIVADDRIQREHRHAQHLGPHALRRVRLATDLARGQQADRELGVDGRVVPPQHTGRADELAGVPG